MEFHCFAFCDMLPCVKWNSTEVLPPHSWNENCCRRCRGAQPAGPHEEATVEWTQAHRRRSQEGPGARVLDNHSDWHCQRQASSVKHLHKTITLCIAAFTCEFVSMLQRQMSLHRNFSDQVSYLSHFTNNWGALWINSQLSSNIYSWEVDVCLKTSLDVCGMIPDTLTCYSWNLLYSREHGDMIRSLPCIFPCSSMYPDIQLPLR